MRRAAVVGHPVQHSLSPVLHGAAYAALGLDDEWVYERHDVDGPDLAAFLTRLDPTWAGLSLTMPLKRVVLGMVDHVEPLAAVVGVANTLLVDAAGRPAVAANTDVHGIVAALAEVGLTEARTGAVLGGGATAASTLAAFSQLGVRSPVVYTRSVDRAGWLVPLGARMSLDVSLRRLSTAPRGLADLDVVVSTLPDGTDQLLADLDAVRGVLLDARYDERPSRLAIVWTTAGGGAVGGERMLLHQAAEQVRLMTGHPAPLAAMDAALAVALAG